MTKRRSSGIISVLRDIRKGAVKTGDADKQYNGQLIDEYKTLKRAKSIAEKEGAAETVKYLDEEMQYIRLKLQPLELPDR